MDEDFKIDEYRKLVLEEHNKYRAMHYAKPIVLDDKINAFAQEWANHLAEIDDMVHRGSDTQKYGECCATMYSMEDSATKMFYDEIEIFEWYNPQKYETGHFTAILWREIKRLGVGFARSKTGKLLTVCNYEPFNNLVGTYWESVKFKVEKVDVELYRKQILEHTNNKRKGHGADPLVLDDAISAYSQEWADKLAKNDKLERRPKKDQKFGENVFMGTEINEIWPTDYWHDESSEFDDTAMEKESTLRFTQLVWKASKKLGVGVARSEQGKWYVVCNYDPPGNVPGKFADNVQLFGLEVDINEYRKGVLAKINAIRAEYHADPLVLDDKMNTNAQKVVEKYAKTNGVNFEPDLQFYGVHYLSAWTLDVNHINRAREQEKTVNWKKLEDAKDIEFTQTIWKATRKMGLGVAKYRNWFFYCICFYPKGNIKGKFEQNCQPK